MDPNETLRKARAAAGALIALIDGSESSVDDRLLTEAEDLAEAFQALDSWLSRGGFLPTAWNR